MGTTMRLIENVQHEGLRYTIMVSRDYSESGKWLSAAYRQDEKMGWASQQVWLGPKDNFDSEALALAGAVALIAEGTK